MSDSKLIPTDPYSDKLRDMQHHPGAVHAQSTVDTVDFYGNAETWVVDTYRTENEEVVLMQVINANGGFRHVLPDVITQTIARHRDRVATGLRRRAGHRLVALRKERGDKLGNPDALAAARKARAEAVGVEVAPPKPTRKRRGKAKK